jgi:curved DNA-binding protein
LLFHPLSKLYERTMAAARHPGAHAGAARARHGEDYEVAIPVTLEQIYHGSETDVSVSLPEYDARGLLHRVPHTFRVAIPKGAADGQKLRLAGKGGPGAQGGKPGDLYVVMRLQPHRLYRISGKDLYIDLPLAPWEAVLGATVQVPTPGGKVEIAIAPGTVAGRKLRLAKRGMPRAGGTAGDLYAVVRFEVPADAGARERELYAELKAASSFDPRAYSSQGVAS